ncbi:MAG: ABC transporter permease [Candidatus Tumulicola sp.]
MIGDFLTVFTAEFGRRIRSRPFQIGVLLGVLGILAFTKLPLLLANAFGEAGSSIVLAGDRELVERAKPLLERDFTVAAVESGARAPALADLKAHGAASWVTLQSDSHGGMRFDMYSSDSQSSTAKSIAGDLTSLNIAVATSLPRQRVHDLLRVPYTVHALSSRFSSSRDATKAWSVSYLLLLVLYMLILINGQLLMASVVEEKTSRIAELLVASISPIPLLYGKIAAAVAAGLIQMVCWILAGVLFGGGGSHAGAASDVPDFSGLLGGSVSALEAIAFVVLFVLGLLQYAMLFAAVGSLINRTEDLGSVSLPIVLPIIAGLLISMSALQMPDSNWAVTASFVPLLSPFVLFARIAMSQIPVWQVALGFAINFATVYFVAMLAGKLYRVGMLLYGRPPSLSQVWNVLRT